MVVDTKEYLLSSGTSYLDCSPYEKTITGFLFRDWTYISAENGFTATKLVKGDIVGSPVSFKSHATLKVDYAIRMVYRVNLNNLSDKINIITGDDVEEVKAYISDIHYGYNISIQGSVLPR